MKKKLLLAVLSAMVLFSFSSCNTYYHAMREPNARLNLTADDLDLSEAVSGEATVVRVLGIDWKRLFGVSKEGTSAMFNSPMFIPVLGNLALNSDCNYALYALMEANPGYDVVLYPQYEVHSKQPVLGLSFIYQRVDIKATARLGKLKYRQGLFK